MKQRLFIGTLAIGIAVLGIASIASAQLGTQPAGGNNLQAPATPPPPTPLPRPILAGPDGKPIVSDGTMLVRINANRNALIRGTVMGSATLAASKISLKSAACTWSIALSPNTRITYKGKVVTPADLSNGSLVGILGKVTDETCTVNAHLIVKYK